MDRVRKFLPGFALALTIAMAAIAVAQNPVPANAGGKHDSCCCASSDCCGDSCDMKKKGAMKNHVASADKDSCCCCGDSCDMKKKDAMKNHITPSDKHDGCCGGDSCDMKQMKNTKETKNKS
jgi:hypothetical protein